MARLYITRKNTYKLWVLDANRLIAKLKNPFQNLEGRHTLLMMIARAFFCLVLMTFAAVAEPITVGEIKVSDGDTIRARDKRYRLVGFDTPEVHSRWRKVSEAEKEKGLEARKRLKSLLLSGPLDLTEVRCSCPERTIGTKKCNHGRLCGILKVGGKNVGETLISEGLAVEFKCGAESCPSMPVWDDILKR